MGDLQYKNRRADLVFNCLAVRDKVHYAEFDSVVDVENSVREMRGAIPSSIWMEKLTYRNVWSNT